MLCLVASLNPVKIAAVKISMEKFFPEQKFEILGVETSSNVPNQPIDADTFIGAENRANSLFEHNLNYKLNADYCVAIEGGIVRMHNRWFELGSVCIIDKDGRKSFGNTPSYELPEDIVSKCQQGIELGTVIDEMIGSSNIKQKGGAISYFSNRKLNRTEVSSSGVDMAILPLLNVKIYYKE